MAAHPSSPPPVTPARRGLRRAWLLGLLPACLALVFALATWLTASESGFSRLWQGIAWLSGGELRVARVSGTLWQGFQLDEIEFQNADGRLFIDRLDLDWQPARLWHRQLAIRHLAIGLTRYAPNPAAPASPWPQLPTSLSLPLDVDIASLQLAGLSVEPGGVALYDVQGRYRYALGHHHLSLTQLRIPQGSLSGQFTLADSAPFALSGRLAGTAEAGSSELGFEGDLQQLIVRGKVRAHPVEVDLSGRFSPFADQPFERIRQLDLRTQNVDPHEISTAWPSAALDVSAHIEPDAAGIVRGQFNLTNRQNGPVSSGRLPLSAAQGAFRLDQGILRIGLLDVALASGRLQVDGLLRKGGVALNARLSGIDPHALHAAAPRDVINGSATLAGTSEKLLLRAGLSGQHAMLQADAAWLQPAGQPWQLRLDQGTLHSGGGTLALQGTFDADRRFALSGVLRHGDPRALFARWPQGDLNGNLRASGRAEAPLTAELALDMSPSRLDGAPVGGLARLSLDGRRLRKIAVDLNLAGNTVQGRGAWGAPGDRLSARIDAPVLARIGFGLAGSAQGQIDLAGTPAAPQVSLNLNLRQLRVPGLMTAQSLTLNGMLQDGGAGVFRLNAAAEHVSGAAWRVDSMRVAAEGTRVRHRIAGEAQLALSGQPFQASWQAEGGMPANQAGWRGTVQALRLAGRPDLTLLAPLAVAIGPDGVTLGAGRLRLAGAEVAFDRLTRLADGRLTSRGRIDGLALSELQPWLDLPAVRGLVVGGSWDVGAEGRGQLMLARQGGDLALPGDSQSLPLALNQARIQLDWRGEHTALEAELTAGIGRLRLAGTLAASPWRIRATTPLAAQLQLDLPQLSALSALSDTAETGGALNADLALSGPLSNPQARGRIQGHDLLLRDRRTGLRLAGGTLAARLDGQTVWLDQLRFVSGQGDASASGQLRLSGGSGASLRPEAAVRVEIRQFSVFDRPDRHLVVSGHAALTVNDKLIALSGRVRADQGRLSLPKVGTPALSDDVMVMGRPAPSSALAQLPVAVDLILDLGDHFVFLGPGLDVALSGQVQVSAHQGMAPSARGQVNVVKGSYKAYGQELEIDTGTITFVGPL
ncbi:MAG: translocation/assembly module TamB domain-containing protein, partial [Paludibacterium sp.]